MQRPKKYLDTFAFDKKNIKAGAIYFKKATQHILQEECLEKKKSSA